MEIIARFMRGMEKFNLIRFKDCKIFEWLNMRPCTETPEGNLIYGNTFSSQSNFLILNMAFSSFMWFVRYKVNSLLINYATFGYIRFYILVSSSNVLERFILHQSLIIYNLDDLFNSISEEIRKFSKYKTIKRF